MTTLGYRAWDVPGETGLLHPLRSAGQFVWSPGVTTARCERAWKNHRDDLGVGDDTNPYEVAKVIRDHPERLRPRWDCDCGLYAYRRPPARVGHTCDCERCHGNTRVAGLVLLTGWILPYTDGFRAQRGRILALVHDNPDLLRKVLRPQYHAIPVVRTWKALGPIRDRREEVEHGPDR